MDPWPAFLFHAALLIAPGAPLATRLHELQRWPADYRAGARA